MADARQASATGDPPASVAAADSRQGEAIRPARRFSKPPNFWLLSTLVYAPLLPLIRISFRHQPKLRNRLFVGALATAFAHGAYMTHYFYNAESYTETHKA
ncbi:hypothetical protein CLOP_g7845 [Closterium sp. NIES-67]|nr:hypothetical protein CLOP_g7845 [Closterium sp. NIES-67]